MRLEGKRILITGAGSGIGRALACEAAMQNALLAVVGRRQAALEETINCVPTQHPALVIPADVTLAEDRERIRSEIARHWGSLDILVNNAGVVEGADLGQTDDAALARIFDTNVLAPIALTRELMTLLIAASPSRIVNVGSMFGDIPYPGFAAYSASKFALRGFSAALRRECSDKGVAVTYAAPRATNTTAAAAFAELIARAKMPLDTPERVAIQIWHAVAARRNSVYARGAERFYVLIERLFPSLIDRGLSRVPERKPSTTAFDTERASDA